MDSALRPLHYLTHQMFVPPAVIEKSFQILMTNFWRIQNYLQFQHIAASVCDFNDFRMAFVNHWHTVNRQNNVTDFEARWFGRCFWFDCRNNNRFWAMYSKSKFTRFATNNYSFVGICEIREIYFWICMPKEFFYFPFFKIRVQL